MLRKGAKSFYEWCVENNNQSYLDLWDYELNEKSPEEVHYQSKDKYYFKCRSNKHNSFLKGINNLIHSKDLICPECNSFYEWCMSNFRQDFIDIWDYENNTENIHYISAHSSKKVYFKISDKCKYYMPVNYATSNKKSDPIAKYNNSFGKYLIDLYGENAINLYWSDKNDKSPFDFSRSSTKEIWIKCQKTNYHEDYNTRPELFIQGCRCPWCASKRIHPKDSFAQYNLDRYGEDWLEKYWCKDNIVDPYNIAIFDNDTKIHVKCMKVDYHDFWITPANYNIRDNICPYCSSRKIHKNDSLGSRHPELIDIWSDKNDKTPYEYAEFTHQKVWLKCKDGVHNDYQKTVSDYTANGSVMCPQCVKERNESFLEEKVRLYLESLNYQLNHEYNCIITPINPMTNFPLPFDNEIVDLKLIIEVHGIQHYEITGWHITQAKASGRTKEEEFEYQKWKDEFKRNYALEHGYFYLEIPYWTIEDETYKVLINEKIEEINKINLTN